MTQPLLTDDDYLHAACDIGCNMAAVKAVTIVETGGKSGFNPDNSPVTLFEGHIFYKYTKGKFAATNPTLCYPHWTSANYGKTWGAEQARLQGAMALDRTAALMSASWGKFQIMGFNFAACGFTNVQDFVNAMYKSEYDQLGAFIDYVKHSGLDDELRDLRWADFAKYYNGPDYQKNAYDTKLAAAYTKYHVA